MSTTALNIVAVRRVAAALGVTEGRVEKAAGELGLVLHYINGTPFVAVEDEDAIRQNLNLQEKTENDRG
jgi:hypothetical protein